MRFMEIPQLTRYGSYEVHVDWQSLSRHLDQLNDVGTLELDPDFQRGRVWPTSKKIAYIEYCLRGGRHSRTLLFNCASWNNGAIGKQPVQLVDGLQRLTAVQDFMADKIDVFGKKYSEYEDMPDRIRQGYFNVNVNDLPDRKSVLTWYLELNDGGVVHTESELNRVRRLLDEELQK